MAPNLWICGTRLVNETDCINWNLYYTDCKPGEINPFSGAISFDNIGLAWVAIFLVSIIGVLIKTRHISAALSRLSFN